MPYKSQAQRRWAHATAGKRGGMTKKQVEEWDKETKGKKLPERVSRRRKKR